jgi:hypothetical protein
VLSADPKAVSNVSYALSGRALMTSAERAADEGWWEHDG